jgi:hypothetical protein
MRRFPIDRGSGIVGCQSGSEAVAVPKASVHLDAGLKFFSADRALAGTRRQPQGAAYSPGISELPGLVGEVFFGDDIFADVPTPKITAQYQLEFQFAFLLPSSLGIDPIRSSFHHDQRSRSALSALMFSNSI